MQTNITARMASDRIRFAIARFLDRLPDRWKYKLSRKAPDVVDGQQLDAQVQLLHGSRPPRLLLEPSIEAGRKRYRRETRNFRGRVTQVGSVRDISIDDTLRVRHYAPPDGDGKPALVYLHGGGFVIGDLDTHDEPCRILCRHGDMHVISVDYRLAPEHPFPAALEDARAALAWAQKNFDRVAIGGDSAGGNLAAVVSHEMKPAAQLLIYPPTDGHTRYPSEELFGEGHALTNRDRIAFAKAYAGGAERNPLVSPIYFEDFSKQPPSLVVIAGFDILRDEGEAYAAKLPNARVLRYPTLGHGFIHLTGVCKTARNAMIEIARILGGAQ